MRQSGGRFSKSRRSFSWPVRFGGRNLTGDGAPLVEGWGAEFLEARFEFAAERFALRAVGGSVDHVGGFRRVGLEIEEFAGPAFAASGSDRGSSSCRPGAGSFC